VVSSVIASAAAVVAPTDTRKRSLAFGMKQHKTMSVQLEEGAKDGSKIAEMMQTISV